jgi:signal transduction histidine kinase
LTDRVRALSQRLRPTVLDDLGLGPAIEWLIDRMAAQNELRVTFDQRGLDGRLSPGVETAAFRIVQEALTNVARHAGVPAASIVVARDAGALEVRVSDVGRGFDPAQVNVHQHGGLSGMRERAAWLGGRVTIDAAPGAGVRILASLPIAVG